MQTSKVLREAEKQRRTTGAEELHILGLSAVIIDCGLDNDAWHGINVVLATDRLIVHEEVTWDVSGIESNETMQKAPDGIAPGSNGKAGMCAHTSTYNNIA